MQEQIPQLFYSSTAVVGERGIMAKLRSPTIFEKIKNIIRDWRGTGLGYEAATPSRKDEGFPWDARAEEMNKASRTTLRARARSLERNSDIMNGVLEAFKRNVVGSGLNMQAKTKNQRYNNKIESLWKDFCHSENCDVTERQDMTEILQMAVTRRLVDGGIMIVTSYDKNSKYGLQLQLREVDDLNTGDYPRYGNNIVSDGVELSEIGKPVAYWLTSYNANGMSDYVPIRIPANRIIFWWDRLRPSQYREITPLAKCIVRNQDLEDYNQAVAFQQKTLACTSVFVEREQDAPGTPGRNMGQANKTYAPISQISAGTVNYLNNGEKAKTLVPNGQAAEAKEFIVTQLRMIASGMGISLESASRDVTQVNYSSARQNLIEDAKTYDKLRGSLIEHVLRPIFKKFVESCELKGLLDGTGFNANDQDYYEAIWLGEGMPWIDPKKEAEADALRINSNVTTLREVCASKGMDWQEVLEQRKSEIEEMKRLGITQEEISKGGSESNDGTEKTDGKDDSDTTDSKESNNTKE